MVNEAGLKVESGVTGLRALDTKLMKCELQYWLLLCYYNSATTSQCAMCLDSLENLQNHRGWKKLYT